MAFVKFKKLVIHRRGSMIKVKINNRKTKSGIKKTCVVYFTKTFLEKLIMKGIGKYGDNIRFVIYFDDVNNNLWRMQKASIDDKNAYTLTVRDHARDKGGKIQFTMGLEKHLVLNLTSENFLVKSIDDIKFIDQDTIEFELVAAD